MLKTRVIPNGALCSAVTTYLPQWVSEGPVALKSVVSSVLGWTLQWSVTLQLSVRLRALAASSGTAWLWLNFQRSATSRVSCEQMASWINLGAFSQLTQWLMEASRMREASKSSTVKSLQRNCFVVGSILSIWVILLIRHGWDGWLSLALIIDMCNVVVEKCIQMFEVDD